MKKILLALAAAAVTVTASAQTNQVLSRNAVGYQRWDLAKGSLSMLRPDFYLLDGGIIKATNLFQRQLPPNSKIIYYDALGQFGPAGQYVNDLMGAIRFSTNITFTHGMGFWVQIPTNAVSNSYALYLMGEVPDSLNQLSTQKTVNVAPYLTQLGYPYPVAIDWTNTTLAKQSRPNDKLTYWDGTGYVSIIRGALKWGGSVVFQPGQGFYLIRTNLLASTNWTEVKPYTWPK